MEWHEWDHTFCRSFSKHSQLCWSTTDIISKNYHMLQNHAIERAPGNSGVSCTAPQNSISHIKKDRNLVLKRQHVKIAQNYTNATWSLTPPLGKTCYVLWLWVGCSFWIPAISWQEAGWLQKGLGVAWEGSPCARTDSVYQKVLLWLGAVFCIHPVQQSANLFSKWH